MKKLIALLSCLLCFFVSRIISGQSPTPQLVRPQGAAQSTPAQLQKQIIESHFQSRDPQPLAQFQNAVPGRLLLQSRAQRLAALRARPAQAPAAHLQDVPANTILPGIQLRPYLDTGALPTAVTSGDFNKDGHQDFVITNGLDNNLWIYFGKGDGTFQVPRIIALRSCKSPISVVAADTRGDGTLDLVVAGADSYTIGVLLNNGDGSFANEITHQVPQPPAALVVNDFNNDGKLDIAAVMDASSYPSSATPLFALFLGDGTGSFSNAIFTDGGSQSTAWNIDSGDVNGDSLPDLLVTGPGPENSTIYLNNGDGTFRAGQIAVHNTSGLDYVLDGRLADVNRDRCLDVVTADLNTSVQIAFGDCSGNFATPVSKLVGESNAALRVADINGDGNPDIITAAFPALDPTYGLLSGNSLTVLYGDGHGNFGSARDYVGVSRAYSIGVADFNGDGNLDFVTANNDSDTVTLYQNDGSGGFGFPQGIYVGVPGQGIINAPQSGLSFADLNSDGKTDAFFLDVGYNGEYFTTSLLNDGTGKFAVPVITDLGINWIANDLSDYRLDHFRDSSHLDLLGIGFDVAYTNGNSFIYFARGNGDGTFTPGSAVAAVGADGILTTGDFNHDGKLDFVAVNGAPSHTLTPFLGNGDGTFRVLTPLTFVESSGEQNGPDVNRIYTGDFNRDGKLDVMVFTTGNGYLTTQSTIWEFLGNGDGTFLSGQELYTGFQPYVLADLNHDGALDIARYDFMWPDGITETEGPAKFTNYLGQANGSFNLVSAYAPYDGVPVSLRPFLQSGDPLSSSLTADLNGDGAPDEAAFQTPSSGGQIDYAQLLMGSGDGTFIPTYDIFPFYLYGYPLYAHDLDGDGKSDMVKLAAGTSAIQVFKGGAAPALQLALQNTVITHNAGCGGVFPDVASSSTRTVTLSTSASGVQLPASVDIPANAVYAQFCFTLNPAVLDWHQAIDINATLNDDTATVYATSDFIDGYSVELGAVSPTTFYAGESTNPVTVTVTAAGSYSGTIHLSCPHLISGDSCQFASDTLTVAPGAPASTTVVFGTSITNTGSDVQHTFTVAGFDNVFTKSDSVVLTTYNLQIAMLPFEIDSGIPGSSTTNFWISSLDPFDLTCSGLPAGVTCSFAFSPTLNPAWTNVALTLNIPDTVQGGNYTVQLSLTSGTHTLSATVPVLIESYSIQPSTADNSWAVVGTARTLTLNIAAAGSGGMSTILRCEFDSGGSCSATSLQTSTTVQPINLNLFVPSGTTTGPHTLNVTLYYGTTGIQQTIAVPINIQDITSSFSTTSLSLNRGASGTVSVTLNGIAGFKSVVSLICSSQWAITCTVSPDSIQLAEGTPQTFTVTLSALQTAKADPPGHAHALLALAALLPLGLTVGLRRRRWHWLSCLIVLALLLPLISCGSGGSGTTGSGGGTWGGGGGGTVTNSYTLDIEARVLTGNAYKDLGQIIVSVSHKQ